MSEVLIRYTITTENEEPVVTYYSDIDDLRVMELCTLSLTPGLLEQTDNKQLALLQLLMTPHVHNSLLGAIVPFVEKMLPAMNIETQNSLKNWLTQVSSLLGQQPED